MLLGVRPQVRCPRKGGITAGTSKVEQSLVLLEMNSEISGAGELGITLGAFVWFAVFAVDRHVTCEPGSPGKRFLAF